MREYLKQIIKKYGTSLKRFLAIASIFWMIIATQTYINYYTIIENTTLVQAQAQNVLDEISYFNNFQLKYLNSEHAQKILAHENNILTYGEALISFQEAPIQTTGEIAELNQEKLTPRAERKQFFSEKLK